MATARPGRSAGSGGGIGPPTGAETARLQLCLERFDAANAADPTREPDGSPKELVYAQRMSAWLDRLEPDAPEEVRLAVRAQHIERWTIPRESYPQGRLAYRQWRQDLGRFHAETAGRIMRGCGYGEETVARVQAIIRKERFKSDPWAQTLEDVACLVFLEHYFEPFADKQEEDSMVNILRRTWRKMSDRGRQAALTIAYPPACSNLLREALAGEFPAG